MGPPLGSSKELVTLRPSCGPRGRRRFAGPAAPMGKASGTAPPEGGRPEPWELAVHGRSSLPGAAGSVRQGPLATAPSHPVAPG